MSLISPLFISNFVVCIFFQDSPTRKYYLRFNLITFNISIVSSQVVFSPVEKNDSVFVNKCRGYGFFLEHHSCSFSYFYDSIKTRTLYSTLSGVSAEPYRAAIYFCWPLLSATRKTILAICQHLSVIC